MRPSSFWWTQNIHFKIIGWDLSRWDAKVFFHLVFYTFIFSNCKVLLVQPCWFNCYVCQLNLFQLNVFVCIYHVIKRWMRSSDPSSALCYKSIASLLRSSIFCCVVFTQRIKFSVNNGPNWDFVVFSCFILCNKKNGSQKKKRSQFCQLFHQQRIVTCLHIVSWKRRVNISFETINIWICLCEQIWRQTIGVERQPLGIAI